MLDAIDIAPYLVAASFIVTNSFIATASFIAVRGLAAGVARCA